MAIKSVVHPHNWIACKSSFWVQINCTGQCRGPSPDFVLVFSNQSQWLIYPSWKTHAKNNSFIQTLGDSLSFCDSIFLNCFFLVSIIIVFGKGGRPDVKGQGLPSIFTYQTSFVDQQENVFTKYICSYWLTHGLVCKCAGQALTFDMLACPLCFLQH